MTRLPVVGSGDTDAWGDILNDFLRASHAENGGLLRSAFDKVYGVSGFGAVGDGVTDDTAAIQAAINAAPAYGIVWLPLATYKISATLVCNKPVYLVGASRGDDNSSSDGSPAPAGATTLVWSGASATPMIHFISATVGNALFGGGVEHMCLDGANVATQGIVSSSNRDQVFDFLRIGRVTGDGLVLDSTNNHLGQSCYVDHYQFTYGSAVAVQSANGLRIDGNVGPSTTQHVIGAVTALTYNGHGVYLKATDNNHFLRVQGVVQSGGAGYGLYFANGSSTTHARKNDFLYVSATVKAESATYGNTIHLLDGEGTKVVLDAGAQLNYRVRDYFTSGVWRTHEYVWTDELWVSPGQLAPISPAVLAQSAAIWTIISLPESGNSGCTVSLRPYHWNTGKIIGVDVYYTQSAAQTSKAVTLEIQAVAAKETFPVSTPSLDQSFSGLAVNDNQNILTKQSLVFTTPITYTRGDKLLLKIRRNPADAGDTATCDLQLHGVKVIYQSDGPKTAGQGPFAIPVVGT